MPIAKGEAPAGGKGGRQVQCQSVERGDALQARGLFTMVVNGSARLLDKRSALKSIAGKPRSYYVLN